MKEVILYQTELIEIGVFAIKPNDPQFVQCGYITSPIIVFPKNSIWIEHHNSDPFVAGPTLVNLYNKGQIYNRYPINKSGDYCHWFGICNDLLAELTGKDKSHFGRENMTCPPEVFILHLELLNLITGGKKIDGTLIEEKVLTLFDELFSEEKSDQTFAIKFARHKKLVECVKETIHSSLDVNLSLQQLSDIHNTSPYHLSRVFKAVSGQGINQYRTQQRLRKLTLELSQRKVDLVDLAFDYGFSSHSHMTASYKKYFGITPSDYQRLT